MGGTEWISNYIDMKVVMWLLIHILISDKPMSLNGPGGISHLPWLSSILSTWNIKQHYRVLGDENHGRGTRGINVHDCTSVEIEIQC